MKYDIQSYTFIFGILLISILIVSLWINVMPKYKSIDGFLSRNDDTKDTYFEGIDAVYWINLDRSTDRRKRMEEMLTDPVFHTIKDIQRVTASDGKDLSMYELLENAIEKEENGGLYGCTTSHIRCIQHVAESDHDIVLILEDDATLEYKPFWRESIKDALKNAPDDWEIIQLGIIPDCSKFPLETRFKRSVEHEIWSTLAYIINKSAAVKYMNSNYKNGKFILPEIQKDVIEHAADHYLFNTFITYHYAYPYFTYPLVNDSEINQQAANNHINPKLCIDYIMKEG